MHLEHRAPAYAFGHFPEPLKSNYSSGIIHKMLSIAYEHTWLKISCEFLINNSSKLNFLSILFAKKVHII